MTTTEQKAALPFRADVPREQTWDIEALFATPAEWEAEAGNLPAAIDALTAHAGKLSQGPEALAAYLNGADEVALP